MSQSILVEHAGSISWIILNRPEQANALSLEMLEAFSQALDTLRVEGGPVVGIRANGKGFCAGMDIGQYGQAGQANPVEDAARLQRNLQRWFSIWEHPKPVIAAVHGYCAGVAAQLCVFADITVLAGDARISEPGLPIGGGYIAPTWVGLVGTKRAKEFAYIAGNSIDAPTAVEWGWANHVVAPDKLISACEALADRIAMTPPEVLRVKKQSINRAAEAMGFRAATASIAEMDALLHLAPSVLDIRQQIGKDGMKSVLAQFKGPASSDLMKTFKE